MTQQKTTFDSQTKTTKAVFFLFYFWLARHLFAVFLAEVNLFSLNGIAYWANITDTKHDFLLVFFRSFAERTFILKHFNTQRNTKM